ncbi:hypothetical protein BJX66DRAFT_337016 [Aspergillus keveii]|uniref:O-methyltransferase domain-containing protein n=1 Tax=Aspergillus keveii TaxID=714993 RepID=A0ABR4G8V9_9EURO
MTFAAPSMTITQRAAAIFQATTSLSNQLAQAGCPEPSFDHGLPALLQGSKDESANAVELKDRLVQMLDELKALLMEPASFLTPELQLPTLSTHPIIRLGIAAAFPEEGTTVSALAASLHLPETLVRRLLSHSATYHIYQEAAPDFFVHTAASRLLAGNAGVRDWVRIGCEELLPATFRISDALLRYPGSEEPEHCGWSLANNTTLPIFHALAQDESRSEDNSNTTGRDHIFTEHGTGIVTDKSSRATVFARAMGYLAQSPRFSPRFLVEVFPWPGFLSSPCSFPRVPCSSSRDDIPRREHTQGTEGGDVGEFKVVDIGGGLGHVSRALAEYATAKIQAGEEKNTTIRARSVTLSRCRFSFITQDTPDVVRQALASTTTPITSGQHRDLNEDQCEVDTQLTFQPHNFFTPQPVSTHGADVYLLRQILHDWSDKYAVRILRALIPGLKPGTKIIVNERIVAGRFEAACSLGSVEGEGEGEGVGNRCEAKSSAHYLVEREMRDYDLYMLAFQNARERTRAEWECLFTTADERFHLTAVRQPAGIKKSTLALLASSTIPFVAYSEPLLITRHAKPKTFASSNMATFHYFRLLPSELRALIWEMTAEPRSVDVLVIREYGTWGKPVKVVSPTPYLQSSTPAMKPAALEGPTNGVLFSPTQASHAMSGSTMRLTWSISETRTLTTYHHRIDS